MAKKIINLTLVLVAKELNLLLKQSSISIQKLFLNRNDLQQHLIEYVLSRIPNIYVALEETSINQDNCQLMSYSLSERQQIKNLINQEFNFLITRENKNTMCNLSSG